VRGGFPESFTAADDLESFRRRKDLIRTFLERDLPLLAPRLPAATIRRLWTMLAQVRAVLAAWRDDYNAVRPYSKLGARTPAETAPSELAKDVQERPVAGVALISQIIGEV
jgi:uncharacterized protein